MGDFRAKLARFMSGRYGIDQLYYGLIGVYLGLTLINALLHFSLLNLLIWAVLLWMVYRALSRNIYKRRSENDRFLRVWNPLRARGELTIRRLKEIRTHRFRSCPNCQATLRLPRKRGKHTVVCPRCHHEFKLRILW